MTTILMLAVRDELVPAVVDALAKLGLPVTYNSDDEQDDSRPCGCDQCRHDWN